MADREVQYNGGIGFFGMLTLIFVVAKITGYIDWSWFWVFSPVIFSLGFAMTFLVIVVILAIIAGDKR